MPARRSSRVSTARPPRETGTRWWAYVLLTIVAAGAVGLAIVALTHDYGVVG